jgi:hypothetical protein
VVVVNLFLNLFKVALAQLFLRFLGVEFGFDLRNFTS